MAFDLLIRGGSVVDGSGSPPVRADVAVRGDQIEVVGLDGVLAGATAATVVDATGRYVTPGYIDIHTHSDRSILLNPRMECKFREGVTTEIGGNCGSAAALFFSGSGAFFSSVAGFGASRCRITAGITSSTMSRSPRVRCSG